MERHLQEVPDFDFSVRNMSIKDMRDLMVTKEGEDRVIQFVDRLRKEAGNKDGYRNLCEAAERKGFELKPEIWTQLLDRFKPLIEATPAGHDQNHIYRDFLAGFALINDPYVVKSKYQVESVAGIFAAGFHDIGNAIVFRYNDFDRHIGHAEVGAFLFYEMTKDLIDNEEIRLIASYAIAAHTQYLQPITLEDGFVKQPYWDEIWEEDGHPIGLGIHLPRFTDRLENNGVIHFVRHLLVTADAVLHGGGKNLSGGEVFENNMKTMIATLMPYLKSGIDGTPTGLEHMLNYKASNFGRSDYSRYDHLLGTLIELMEFKSTETTNFVEKVAVINKEKFETSHQQELDTENFEEERFIPIFKNTLRQISQCAEFKESWLVIMDAFMQLEKRERARWKPGIEYVGQEYITHVLRIASLARQNKNPLISLSVIKNVIDTLYDLSI